MTTTRHPQDAERPLPPGWRWVRLGEVCEVVSGVTLGRQIGGRDIRHVAYLRVANVKDGYLDLADVGNTLASADEVEALALQRGDLLLTEGGDPDKLGRGAVWDEQVPGCIHQNHVFRARFDRREVEPEFAAFEVGSPYGKAYFLHHAKQTTGIATINQRVLKALPLMLPPLPEQCRIAAVLKEQMAAVGKARAAAEARLEAVNALPAAFLRHAFPTPGRPLGGAWRWVELSEACDLLPSRSVSTAGDAEVLVVTTACLTERGFSPSGVKQARMAARDVADCVLSDGEVLVARSNTPELVGRAAMFEGDPVGVVASDLTIRVCSRPILNAGYLTGYLSALFLAGYWRDHAGGASGSMKKITRTQVLGLPLPLPPLPEQQRTAAVLRAQLAAVAKARAAAAAELETINALPAALLRRAFSGEL